MQNLAIVILIWKSENKKFEKSINQHVSFLSKKGIIYK